MSYSPPYRRTIILSSTPRGVYTEGIITGTPTPGVIVTQSSDGTWVPASLGTSGFRDLMTILLPDLFQGKTVDDAYVTGTRCFLYVPAPGEFFMMLLKNISGTGDHFAIGDKLIVETGSGKLLATTGSPQSNPFKIVEAVPALTVDTLAKVQFTGY